ncbi:MAG: hypothetical protein Q9M23_02025, partial [Mariprofundaceae bacterium]|nr:hypothetical protein [Mariprofundaceae bacterium]
EQFSAWQNSRHAQAFSPGLIGQFPGMSHTDRNDCLTCHAPLTEQKYKPEQNHINAQQSMQSLALKLKQPEGFDRNADTEAVALPLRHAGVTCAACHVREWQRFGPPQRGTDAVGHIDTPAHGGFTASPEFEQSNFCASCHQFPQSYAINGKPMENTLEEWKQSRFAAEGTQCQSCHMPDRKHEFKGIHDPAMVKKGLRFTTAARADSAALTIRSVWIGHAFPTYVTPKVIIRGEELDARGQVLNSREWEIIREVAYIDGWEELRDTRLLPGESRRFVMDHVLQTARQVRFTVKVIPDNFYKTVYRSFLDDENPDVNARKLMHLALKEADMNDYRLFSALVTIGNEASPDTE